MEMECLLDEIKIMGMYNIKNNQQRRKIMPSQCAEMAVSLGKLNFI